MNINDIYKQLTNVDIDYQKKLWTDRGKGYYGEFLVFCELYKNLQGTCKILMNLNVPTENEKTTEIDLILIHETGIYVFEIKHYKGTIYGDDNGYLWTQYFRTVKNNTFKNPILQNEYHIKALEKFFNNIPIKSVVVFTNYDCNIKVKNSNPNIHLCTLQYLRKNLEKIFKNSESILSMEKIDEIFDKLSQYSQMQEIILYNGEEKSFTSWLQPTLQELIDKKSDLNKQIIKNKKNNIVIIIINILAFIACIIWIIISINLLKANYNKKLENATQDYEKKLIISEQNCNIEIEKLKQNLKQNSEIENEYIEDINKYFSVSNVSISQLSNASVTFTAKISKANDIYGMALTKESKYIVKTIDGNVHEYDVFGKHLYYSEYSNMIGKGIRDYGNLAKIQFQGIFKDEIMNIKINNINLFKLDAAKTLVKENMELELYSK